MSTLFDFTFNLNTQASENEILNALRKNRVKAFEPKSFFFTESDITAQANASGAYGPENGTSTTRFNITTKLGLANKKAYAVTSGQVLIVPQTADKVNVFIKPLKNIDVGSAIKYFVYRGLRKTDFLDTNDNILAYSTSDKTPFMVKVWSDMIGFNDITDPASAVISGSLFGFSTTELATTRIDEKFFNVYDAAATDENKVFNLPIIEAGQHFGQFMDNDGGFEIVLNDGFYYQEKSDTGFNFDMDYARAGSVTLDIADIASDPNISEKIYRENVQKFLDPAAFYGAHITEKENGEVSVENNTKYNTKGDIYGKIVSKFYNKHKLYLYIQGNRGRSFNYDASLGVEPMKIGVSGTVSPTSYQTMEWPIIIQEIQQTHPSVENAEKGFNELTFQLKFKTPSKNLTIYNSHGNCANEKINGNFLEKDAFIEDASIETQEYTNNINFKLLNTYNVLGTSLTTNSIASFIYINQFEDEVDYFNDFFGPVLIEEITKKNDGFPANVSTKTKNNNVKITKRGLDSGVSFQIKTTIPQVDSSGVPNIEDPFRLYILQRFDSNNPNFSLFSDRPTFTTVTGDSYRGIIDTDDYGDFQYGSKNFKVFKGKILDGLDEINTLQLINFQGEGNVSNFIHLGLMGDDYRKVIYNSLTETTTNHIPNPDANVFFHLEIDPSAPQSSIFKRYKLGVKVESFSLLGVSHDIIYPSSDNEVLVYTVDGHYFFTRDFSEKFQFVEEMANANINFKPMNTYAGEFGFDWMRLQDGTVPGYEESIANGYTEPRRVWNPLPEREFGFEAPAAENAFFELRKEYINIINQQNAIYYVPYLTIYPSGAFQSMMQAFPNDTPPPYMIDLMATLDNHENIIKLSLDYDKKYFDVTAQFPNSYSQGTLPAFNVQILCLEEFSADQYIKIMSHSQEPNELPKIRLAGIIKVCKNNYQTRERIKIALFSVQTKVDQSSTNPETGSYSNQEIYNLKRVLFQSSIYADIVGPIVLPLTNDSKFWKNHDYINQDGEIYSVYPVGGEVDEKQDYLLEKTPAAYKNHFRVYAFDLSTNEDTAISITGGNVQDIGKHSVCLYSGVYPRPNLVLAHEVCHGLGLRHTHQDTEDLEYPAQKYVYPYGGPGNAPGGSGAAPADVSKSTNNVMSYNTSNINGPWSTWRWQWKIMHENIKNYLNEE